VIFLGLLFLVIAAAWGTIVYVTKIWAYIIYAGYPTINFLFFVFLMCCRRSVTMRKVVASVYTVTFVLFGLAGLPLIAWFYFIPLRDSLNITDFD
jgi:hypothetical protein